MIQLSFGFFLAAILSLIITPLMIKLAMTFHVVDIPTERKVHTLPIPRLGGCGIFLTFVFVVALISFFQPTTFQSFFTKPQRLYFILGALVSFGVGLFDDFKSLPARNKLCFQIIAAILAYAGGIRIDVIGIQDFYILDLEYTSPIVSIFWIVLVINAINLIDGLDGLAAGICMVVACFLCYICFTEGHVGAALMMAILGGSILGFLRYNFNPASIFMGDGGSYFLGYMLATISVISLEDNKSTFTILIPMLTLALPIIDMTIATIRRFIHGQAIFSPDKKHFHHMLLQNGFSHLNSVLILYGVTILVSLSALTLTRTGGEKSITILVLIGLLVVIGINKLGYFKSFNKSSLLLWLNDISYEAGLSRQRRSFFDIQVQINESKTLPELWRSVERALIKLKIINCAVYLNNNGPRKMVKMRKQLENRRITPALSSTVTLRQSAPDWYWINPEMELDEHNRSLFRVEMELNDKDDIKIGTLLLIKDQRISPVGHSTLKSIEHLRRSITIVLARILREKGFLGYYEITLVIPPKKKSTPSTSGSQASLTKEKMHDVPNKTLTRHCTSSTDSHTSSSL